MFRQTSSRNHRSKGFRVKHALQIFLLLAVCIWLLYQVKHSHDKKKAFDENNARIANKAEVLDTSHEILKLGRKDLNRGAEMASENEKHTEEENEEEEEDEHKPEEPEDEERVVDEERGGGDDEIDEHDRESTDEEAEHGEEFGDDEEKETREEEKEQNEEKDGQNEDTGSSLDDQDHDEGDKNSQEAREENYKGDDASSAVVRDTQMIRSEVENGGGSGNLDSEQQRENLEKNNVETIQQIEDLEKNNVENETKTNGTENGHVDQNGSSPMVGETPIVAEGETVNNPSVNATASEEKGTEIIMSKSENESLPNSPATESNDQTELHNNVTSDNAETHDSNLQNETSILGSTVDQNVTVSTEISEHENPNMEHVALEQTEKSNTTAGLEGSDGNTTSSLTTDDNAHTGQPEINGSEQNNSDSQTASEQTEKSDMTSKSEDSGENNASSSTDNGHADADQAETNGSKQNDSDSQIAASEQTEKSEMIAGSERSGEDNASSLTADENADAVQPEITDSSSSLVTQEEKDALIDLGTLPENETGGRSTEDVAAE